MRRMVWSMMLAKIHGGGADDHCARAHPQDRVALALTKAAMSGGSTTVSGWAAEVVQTAVGQWLASLYPQSAAAALMPAGITVPIDANGRVNVPGRSAAPTAAPWVAEGSPIPASQEALTSAPLAPRKIAILVAFTRELARLSAAEAIFNMLLEERAAVSLDAAYFSTTDTTTAGHRGLLFGVAASTANAGTGPQSAYSADLATLAKAVAPASADSLYYVASPGRAAAMVVASYNPNVQVLPSQAVADTRVIAVDAASLVHGFGPDPAIDGSTDTTLVMADVPVDIGTPGSPAVVGAPTKSLFQTAQLASRMILDIAFAKRKANAVAYIDNPTW
jgi:hypothetical protein